MVVHAGPRHGSVSNGTPVETAGPVEQPGVVQLGIARTDDLGARVEAADFGLQPGEPRSVGHVAFVQHHRIGQLGLLPDAGVQVFGQPVEIHRVQHRDERRQADYG